MRRVLFHLALVGFLCRALVPAGFMPAPLSEGGPIRVCHGGPVGALITALAEGRIQAADEHHGLDPAAYAGFEAYVHSSGEASGVRGSSLHASSTTDPTPVGHAAGDGDHGAAHDAVHEHWERCPIGAAFAFTLLTGEAPVALPAYPPSFVPVEPVGFAGRLLAASYDARAPPVV